MNSEDIIVYGASGYTGKLIAEYLGKAGIPFVAAGRSAERLEQEMAKVPGLDSSLYSVYEVAHEQASLEEAFKGKKVVVNVVGPFGQLAEPVIRATLNAGCHYLDTTGEQDWIRLLRDEYADKFTDAKLVCCPALSWMWAAGNIAAELALEQKDVDSLDILYVPNGSPTEASTLSFLRMATQPQYKLIANEIEVWEAASYSQVQNPAASTTLVGLPWGGGAEPLWYEDDDRVLNCRVQVGFEQSPLTDFVINSMENYKEAAKTKSAEELEALTNEWGDAIKSTPPREIPEINRCFIICHSRGTMVGRTTVLHATSPYLQTGALIAEGCRQLLADKDLSFGFQAPAAVFGARPLANMLAGHGLHCEV